MEKQDANTQQKDLFTLEGKKIRWDQIKDFGHVKGMDKTEHQKVGIRKHRDKSNLVNNWQTYRMRECRNLA